MAKVSNTTQTAQQAVTSTSNQTSQAGQTPVLDFLLDPLTIALFLIALVGIAIAGALIYIVANRETEEEFQKENLEDVVKPEFKKVLKKDGKVNKSTIRRDLRKEGEIYKDVRFTETDNLLDHMESLEKEDNDFNHNINVTGPDNDEIESLKKSGKYSDEQIDRINEIGVVPHRLLYIRPDSITGKFIWIVTDEILDLGIMSDLRLVPEHKLVDNPGDNSVSIDRDLQFRPFAGVQLPLKFESFSILHAVVTRQMYEASLEDQVNYSEKINFFDSKFSQQIQKLEAEAQAENNKYNNGVAGDVNNS